MKKSLDEFQKARDNFLQKQPQANKNILKTVSYIINRLVEGPKKDSENKGQGFLAWKSEILIEKEAILSSYIYRLLQLKSEYESKADWLKTQLNGEEQDIYENAIKKNKKVTIDGFRRQLSKIQRKEIQKIILLKNEAKNIDAFIQCIEKFCLAITHRLKEMRDKK